MKWFFVLLLLINVAYLGWEIDRNAKRYRINQSTAISIPAEAKQLQMLSELEQQPGTRNTTVSEEADYTMPVLPIEMNPNTEKMIQSLLSEASIMQLDNTTMSGTEIVQTLPAPESSKPVCYTYGPIPDAKESEMMATWLNDRGITYNQRQTAESGQQKFWIYLSPQGRANAIATVEHLRQQGIDDLHLIRSGNLLNAVSLGLYSSQAAVNRRLAEIKATGYQPVVVPYAGDKQIHWFDVRIVQNSTYVNELFSGFPARFNALPVKCDEIAMQ